ncbi:MAG: substrate-binding domain-containing protein [Betaproteobacteria bacterium]
MSLSTRVLASTALSSVLIDCLPIFDQQNSGHTCAEYLSTVRLLARLKKNTTAPETAQTVDLLIATREAMTELAALGFVLAESLTALAHVGISLCVRQGMPSPDIHDAAALKNTLLAIDSLAYSQTGQSGLHFAKVLEQLGITEALKTKTTITSGGLVGDWVARGDVSLGVQQTSEILAVPGVSLIGPLPEPFQLNSHLVAGIHTHCENRLRAQRLIGYLRSPLIRTLLIQKGLTPALNTNA